MSYDSLQHEYAGDDRELKIAPGVFMESLIDDACLALRNDVASSTWILVGQLAQNESVRHVVVPDTTIRVGRRPDCELCLSNAGVSGIHAEITPLDNALEVRDLGSTNGTFVNGEIVRDRATVHENDIVQFASVAVRVQKMLRRERPTVQALNKTRIRALTQFDKLINRKGVVPHFQPVVRMETSETVGYEVLARSTLRGLENPFDMFQVAAQLGLAEELSRISRAEGVRLGVELPSSKALYLNTHPAEINGTSLIESLTTLRASNPTQPIVLEVHEGSVSSRNEMRELRASLTALDIQLAYDDFGAGQARLNELTEVPPDILKFDILLVRDIDSASGTRQKMIASLVEMVLELGITPLAEGIESVGEANTCRELGFELAQGYHFGRPTSVDNMTVETERIQLDTTLPSTNM